jgi:hypothetical protein
MMNGGQTKYRHTNIPATESLKYRTSLEVHVTFGLDSQPGGEGPMTIGSVGADVAGCSVDGC